MKIILYMDAYVGQKDNFYASSNAIQKYSGIKRYRLEFEIPDPAEPDMIMNPRVLESKEVEQ